MSLLRILLCLLLFASGYARAAEGLQVQLVLSDESTPYQRFLDEFRRHLPNDVRLAVVQRTEAFEAAPADLIVTVGVKAANQVAGKSALPLLAAMVPAAWSENAPRGRGHSALYLDQPISRQLALIRAALPERRRIGVLYSERLPTSLRAEVKQWGGELVFRSLPDPAALFAELDELLAGSEVLLAQPDSVVYNGNTIRNILLSSYRRGIPLVGFSAAYVRAGAVCALFSTPEDLAVQAAEMTQIFARTRKLPETQYPQRYSLAVNQEVARTLGLNLPPVEALRAKIDSATGGAR